MDLALSPGLGFALEAGEPLGVGGERLRQALQRDVAPEPRVGGAKHLAIPLAPRGPTMR